MQELVDYLSREPIGRELSQAHIQSLVERLGPAIVAGKPVPEVVLQACIDADATCKGYLKSIGVPDSEVATVVDKIDVSVLGGKPVDEAFAEYAGLNRVKVHIEHDESKTTKEVIVAIAKRGNIFQRLGKVVELRRIPDASESGAVKRSAGTYTISEVRSPRARLLAAESCTFTRNSKKGKAVPPVAANPPDWLANAILASSRYPFPTLTAIAQTPSLRADGSLIDKWGYDRATGIFLASDLVVNVSDAPTKEEATAAAKYLLELVEDFPFAGVDGGAAGKSAWLSGVLSVAARPAIDGPVPLHLVDASMRGSGKTKLADIASIITTGRTASRMAFTSNEEEMDKRIMALALAGDASVLLDNVVGKLGGQNLAMAITSTLYKGRLLGQSEMAEVPMRLVWWATGNGMTIDADLARRSVLVRLEPQCDHPEERTGPAKDKLWKYPRLLDFVRDQRGGPHPSDH